MNRTLAIFAILVLLLVGGGVAWLILGDSAPEDTPTGADVGMVAADATPASVASPPPTAKLPEPEPEAAPPVEETAPVDDPAKQQRGGPGVIRGKIVPEEDASMNGVVLRIFAAGWQSGGASEAYRSAPEPFAEVPFDAGGSFVIEDLAVRGYLLTAVSPAATGQRVVNLSVASPTQNTTVALLPGGSVSGFVLTADGAPVEGAVVAITHRRSDPRTELRTMPANRLFAERTATDAEGAFSISCWGTGDVKLCALKDGYAPTYSEEFALGTTNATIVLGDGGDVLGQVVEKGSQRPVADARIRVRGETPLDTASTTTGSEGHFFLAGLAPGKYSATVEHDVLIADAGARSFEIFDGRETGEVRIEMLAGATVSGRIYDQDTGRGIAGAVIRVGRIDGQSSTESEPSSLDGNFAVTKLAAGSYSLFYEAKGYPRPRDRGLNSDVRQFIVGVGDALTDMDIAISKGLLVSGRVVDGEGNPVAAASVLGRSRMVESYSRAPEATKADGRFDLADFKPANDIYLTASKEGFAAAPVGPLTLLDENLTGIEIVMQPEASVSGIIVDTAGKPVPKARMIAVMEPSLGSPMSAADAQGEFTIKGLAEGTYRLLLSQAGSNSFGSDGEAATVELAPGEEVTGLRLVLNTVVDGLSISGRVTDDEGRPIRQASLNAHSSQGGFTQTSARTDSDGKYEITGLKDAVYQVQVYHHQHSSEAVENIAAGTQNLDFVLAKRGSIEGRVLAARTRQPVTDFFIYQTKGAQRFDSWMMGNLRPVHDAEGRFSLNDVEAGEATVFVQAKGHAPTSQHVGGVVGGGTVSGIEILLELGVEVEGTVVNSSGEPVAGAQVFEGEVPRHNTGRGALTQTDREGRFLLDTLPGGGGRIAVSHPSYAPGYADVNLAAGARGTVRIVLGSGGVVEGLVTSGGKPLVGQPVGVYFPSAGGQGFSAQTQADAKGWYEIKGLPDGTATVSAHIPSTQNRYRSRNQQAEIRDGAVTRVDFDFPAATASIEGYVFQDAASRTPVPDAGISLIVQAPGGDENSFVRSGSDGSYVLENLPAGTATLRVYAQGGSMRSSTLEIREGQHLRHDIDLGGGASVVCTFTRIPEGYMASAIAFAGDIPMPQSIQEMNSRENMRLMAGMAQVDTGGVARISGLEPGTYTIFGISHPNPPQVTPQEREEIMRQTRFQRAVVTLGESGATELRFDF